MFGRRRFRYERRPPWARPGFQEHAWGRRRALVPGVLHPRLQSELRRANHLMAVGDHVNAGNIFQSLAMQARDRGFLFPAPMLFMQAARAFLLGESFALSLESARSGFDLLAQQERWRALIFEGDSYIQELIAVGQKGEAQKLRDWLNQKMAAAPAELKSIAQEKTLPEKCPYCGASLSLEQVNASGQAAECSYCGSVVLPRTPE